MRLATYNVEWMNALFDDAGNLLIDAQLSARHQTTRAAQIEALGTVFTALDACGIMIIEAPDTSSTRSTITALETFARHFDLRARKAVTGQPSGTEQEIAFLYDPDVITARYTPSKIPAGFSKPPLQLFLASHNLHVIGVHAKSKTPHGRLSEADFRRIATENRRKQLAECQWLRSRALDHLKAQDSLIIMGDFNDGPGIDEYERLFGRSGIEIVLGLQDPLETRLTDPHALMALAPGLHPTSARFWLAPKQAYFEALLDFIMLSPDLAAKNPRWHIWHPFNDPKISPTLSQAILTGSDHFPVTLDLP